MEWGDRWLVTLNATKTKPLSFNHHRSPLLVPVEINGIELPEETSFCLPCLTFTPSMDWKPYIYIYTVHCKGCYKEIWLPLYGPAFPYSWNHLVSVQIYHLAMYGVLFPYLGWWSKFPWAWSASLSAETGSQLSRLLIFFWFASPVTQEGCCYRELVLHVLLCEMFLWACGSRTSQSRHC